MYPLEFHISGLDESQSAPGQYALILEEDHGQQLIILIGRFEARSIALALESIEVSQPQTHDAWLASLLALGVTLQEVLIDGFSRGVFTAQLRGKMQNGDAFAQTCRPSDAIALALRADCPIRSTPEVLELAAAWAEQHPAGSPPNWEHLTIEELQQLLTKALEEEKYELAQKLREAIEKRA